MAHLVVVVVLLLLLFLLLFFLLLFLLFVLVFTDNACLTLLHHSQIKHPWGVRLKTMNHQGSWFLEIENRLVGIVSLRRFQWYPERQE
jgi:hypothetical protein